jgi:polar amino acid transport system substrate-binding protein
LKEGAMTRAGILPVVATLLPAAGCDFPRDAGGTLAQVRTDGVLRVGVSERPPWVIWQNEQPAGIEPRLMQVWAEQLGAKVEWVRGGEWSLVEALKGRQVDVLIGGHLFDSPWAEDTATSLPYLRAAVIVAVPPGTLPPVAKSELRGQTVAHAALRPDLAALIAATGARPEALPDLRGRLAAIYAFEAGRLALTPTAIVLTREQHVIIVAPGESALLLELDRFLSNTGRRLALAVAAPT